MRKDISSEIRNYIGDIKYLERPQEFANTTDGSSELEMEMRRYAPKFLEKELEGYHWEGELTNIGVRIIGYGYSDELRDILIEHFPNFTMFKEEGE